MNAHCPPPALEAGVAATPPARLDLTERDERMLALRDDGATSLAIGAALGMSGRAVELRVSQLRKAGLTIRSVARERALTRKPGIVAEQHCAHRVYVVPVDAVGRAAQPPRRGPNAEALRQHREAAERRLRMEAAVARAALPPPTPPIAPVARLAPRVEPAVVEAPSGQGDAPADEERWRGMLARAHPIRRVLLVTARHFDLAPADVIGPRRLKDVVRARHVAIYLAKTLTRNSLPEIGRRLGGLDHTTVLHATRRIERLLRSDPVLADDVRHLRASLEEAAGRLLDGVEYDGMPQVRA